MEGEGRSSADVEKGVVERVYLPLYKHCLV